LGCDLIEAVGSQIMLNGIRVVELAIWVAGPGAGGILSDWGAEVIKVEGPAGDPMRNLFGNLGIANQAVVPPFELDNRGKRCVMLDLRTDDATADFELLLSSADVFLTNLRPDALERLGLDHEAVRLRHPKLIYASVTGYGLDGDDCNRAGYDIGAFWARSSIAHSLVPPGELPPSSRSGTGDHTTAMSIVSGICAALFNRERTGEGRLVHTSLLRTGVYVNGWDLGTRAYFGKISATRSRKETQAPLINSYRAGDGRAFWLLGLEQDRHWPTLLAAMERPDLATDERFVTAVTRGVNAAALIEILDGEFAKRTYEQWVARFDENDVWFAPLNSLADALNDPQIAAAGAWVTMPGTTADGSEYRLAASPVGFSDWTETGRAVEALGASTEAVLAPLRSS
jgi:crotonobetainyl-CoA:carnitine CoA-transferase CaiB-like acyl-CoA transferase